MVPFAVHTARIYDRYSHGKGELASALASPFAENCPLQVVLDTRGVHMRLRYMAAASLTAALTVAGKSTAKTNRNKYMLVDEGVVS